MFNHKKAECERARLSLNLENQGSLGLWKLDKHCLYAEPFELETVSYIDFQYANEYKSSNKS